MKKLLLVLLCSISVLLGSINLNTASKKELTSIKGIGEKKATLIIDYRKSHQIKNVDELKVLKGFGPKLIDNIKKETK